MERGSLSLTRARAHGHDALRRLALAFAVHRTAVLAIAGGIAVIALAAVIGGTGGRAILLIAFVPVAVWVTLREPTVAVGLLPAVQAADWVRLQTAVASLAPRTMFIVLLALARARPFVELLRSRRDLWLVSAALGVWWLLAPLRASHSIFEESPLRGLVTEGSFVAIAIIGMTFANDRSALRSIARGSAAALLALGLASLLVSVGVLPEPGRVSPGREVFGLQSPFSRNYGFDVPFDAVALLVPLCAPYYLLGLLDPRPDGRGRREAAVVLTLLLTIFVLLFQARGMVAQLAIAAVLMSFLVGRRVLAVTGMGLLVAATLVAGRTLLNADAISTNIRVKANIESVATAFETARNLSLGVDEREVMESVLSEPGLNEATSGYSIAIHNLFLSNLVTGGIVSMALLVAVVVYAGARVLRSDLRLWSSRVLLVAFILVVLEMNIEPLRANIVGAWLILGLALGIDATRRERGRESLDGLRPTQPAGTGR